MGLKLFPLVRHALSQKRQQGPTHGHGCRHSGRKRAPTTNQTSNTRRILVLADTVATSPLDVEAPRTLQRRFKGSPLHGMWPNEGSSGLITEPSPGTVPWPGMLQNPEPYPPSETLSEVESGMDDPMDKVFLEFYQEKIVQQLQKKAGDSDHLPISGNLYMYRAIAGFGDSSGLFQEKATPVLWVGLLVVMLVQIIGPLILLNWAKRQVEFSYDIIGFDKYRQCEQCTTFYMQRILGLLFLILFTVNGLYTLKSDQKETEKMVQMCKVFERAAEKYVRYDPPNETWLWVGAFVNVGCLILCSISMVLLFVLAENDKGPKDIIFDAFGITFLYNLDDPVGDLSFLDEKWDEDLMGDIYGMLADNLPIMDEISKERRGHCSPDDIYGFGVVAQWVLIFLLPLTFIFVEWEFVELV